MCRTCVLLSAKAPEKAEPVLADKEIIMAALNIKYSVSVSISVSCSVSCSVSVIVSVTITVSVSYIPTRSMDFGGSFTKLDGEEEGEGETEIDMNSVPVLLDLAFASNVRYLDDHEMYLTDQVQPLTDNTLDT